MCQTSAPLLLFSVPPADVLQGGVTAFSKKLAFIRQLEYGIQEFLREKGKAEGMHLSMFGSIRCLPASLPCPGNKCCTVMCHPFPL